MFINTVVFIKYSIFTFDDEITQVTKLVAKVSFPVLSLLFLIDFSHILRKKKNR